MTTRIHEVDERPHHTSSRNRSRQVDLPDFRVVAQKYLGPGKGAGRAVMYCSPFRTDNRPSFAAYDDGWYDHGTGEHGDSIDFVRRYNDCDYRQAVATLTGETSPPPVPRRTTQLAASEPPANWQEEMSKEADRAADYLWSNRPDAYRVLNYLRKKRGLADRLIRGYGLGYNPNRRKTAYNNPETGKRVMIPPGIVIPVWADGTLWALHIRCRVGNLAEWLGILPDHDRKGNELAKYRYVAGSKPTAPFNGDMLQAGRDVLIVEGEFDAMLAQQMIGDKMAVVTQGSATGRLSPRWRERLNGQVFTLFDSDQPGQDATRRLAQSLGSKPLTLPAGKDITEFITEHSGNLVTLFSQARAWWTSGVPDSVRSALLNYFPPSTAPVVELINEATRKGVIDPDDFTLSNLQTANDELGYGIPRTTLSNAVSALVGVFFQKLETESSCSESVSKFRKNAEKGRKAIHFRCLSLSEIRTHILRWAKPRIYEHHHSQVLAIPTATMMQTVGVGEQESQAVANELEQTLADAFHAQGNQENTTRQSAKREYLRLTASLDNTHSTPLPSGWPVGSAKDYRAAFLHGIIKASPGRRFSRQEIGDLVGVERSSVDALKERAGVRRAKKGGEFEDLPIKSSEDLYKQVKRYAGEVRGYPRQIISTASDGTKKNCTYETESGAQFVADELAAGAQVIVRFQVANSYQVVSESPPEIVQRQPTPKAVESRPGVRSEGKNERYYGPAYDPRWMEEQLKLALKLMGWQGVNGQLVNPNTGQTAPNNPLEIIEILIGRSLSNETWDPLRAVASELGAVVSLRESGWQAQTAGSYGFGKTLATRVS